MARWAGLKKRPSHWRAQAQTAARDIGSNRHDLIEQQYADDAEQNACHDVPHFDIEIS